MGVLLVHVRLWAYTRKVATVSLVVVSIEGGDLANFCVEPIAELFLVAFFRKEGAWWVLMGRVI